MARKMPAQKPGKSEQSVGTPPEFLRSVLSFLDIEDFTIDLAAEKHNAVTSFYIGKKRDTFMVDWHKYRGWCWLNPEYSRIAPYARKCAEEMELGAQIAVLIPASPGSNWWRDYVHGVADVRFLNGRVTFLDKDGQPIKTRNKKTGVWSVTPYPKDLALLLYSTQRKPGYHIWNWRNE